MTAEGWTAIIAAATFGVFYTATILGLAAWIAKQFGILRKDFDQKHVENAERFQILNDLVIAHETILNHRNFRIDKDAR
ncbi:MAG: hypothetical protein KGJ13_06635 [Patescibacteria group bacterium]|nr:hypothetical protein [Patescibacteria group bacterium]